MKTPLKVLAWIAGLAGLLVAAFVVFLLSAIGLRIRREVNSVRVVSIVPDPLNIKAAQAFQILSDSPQWRGKSVIVLGSRAAATAGEVMQPMKTGNAILVTENSNAATQSI